MTYLTIIKTESRRFHGRSDPWSLCLCICGAQKWIRAICLKGEHPSNVSCGCVNAARRKNGFRLRHGMNKTPEHTAWSKMKRRCLSKSCDKYEYYGGKGVTVHAEWVLSFESFLSHIGKMPSPGLTLDRIDPFGNYEPGNVRWADRKTQSLNKRCSLYVSVDGVKTPLKTACATAGVNYYSARSRMKRGVDPMALACVYVDRMKTGEFA